MSWLSQDRARLQQFREGDAVTLREVYLHYAPQILRLLAAGFSVRRQGQPLTFASTRNRFQRDDIVQETFVRAFAERARLAYDGVRPYRNYLLTIASRVAVDLYKREARYWPLDSADLDVHEPSPLATPEQSLAQQQLAELLRHFVDELKAESQQLWRLRYEQRLSRPLVAAQMGLSEMQVRTREQRLRALLFRRLVAGGYRADSAALLVLALLTGVA